MYLEVLAVFLLSAVLTWLVYRGFTKFAKVGGNLYTAVRGGTPRAVGLAPFIVLIIFLQPPYQYLIGIIGIFAFIDDLVGRKRVKGLSVEVGQLSRGIGMLLVMVVGFYYNFGAVAVLIALMIQPMNISDMQPGSACSTVIIMTMLVVTAMFSLTSSLYMPALIILAACLGYAPLDYKGRIMMGEIGNHSFGVALGILYAVLASVLSNASGWGAGAFEVFIWVLVMFLITTCLIAFIRRKNLEKFLQKNLEIQDPCFGDYFMDVLTGGGLGDLARKFILGKRQITIKNKFYKHLGFRRLVFNPYAPNES
jgi:UDP-GlcNAc:undecaprenyl-phosphate/decaprenyl-phosphate GlcNAc-1-phosphate transferase